MHAAESPGLISDSQRRIRLGHLLGHADDVRGLGSFVWQDSRFVWLRMVRGVLGEAHTRMGIADLIAFIDEGIRIGKHVTRERMLYTWHLCLRFDLMSSGEASCLYVIRLGQTAMRLRMVTKVARLAWVPLRLLFAWVEALECRRLWLSRC